MLNFQCSTNKLEISQRRNSIFAMQYPDTLLNQMKKLALAVSIILLFQIRVCAETGSGFAFIIGPTLHINFGHSKPSVSGGFELGLVTDIADNVVGFDYGFEWGSKRSRSYLELQTLLSSNLSLWGFSFGYAWENHIDGGFQGSLSLWRPGESQIVPVFDLRLRHLKTVGDEVCPGASLKYIGIL